MLKTQLARLGTKLGRSRLVRRHAQTLGLIRVRQSPLENVYHCCTQKTASQWFKAVFRDPIFYRHTGLDVVPFVELGLHSAGKIGQFAPRSIATHLYVDYPTYQAIPKPSRFKAFFVLRDPRDAVVSWYFSARYSHAPIDPIPEMRRVLSSCSFQDGVRYTIDRLVQFGYFDSQRSWISPRKDDRIRLFRYEDLAQDNSVFLRRLLRYLEVEMCEAAFASLSSRHHFRATAGGRAQGDEDVHSHLRKGVAGDWRNYFEGTVERYFRDRTGDLVETLGYE